MTPREKLREALTRAINTAREFPCGDARSSASWRYIARVCVDTLGVNLVAHKLGMAKKTADNMGSLRGKVPGEAQQQGLLLMAYQIEEDLHLWSQPTPPAAKLAWASKEGE